MVTKQLHSGAKWHFRVTGFFSFFFVIFFLSMFFGGILVSFMVREGVPNFMSFIPYVLVAFIVLLVLAEVYARFAYKFFKYEFTPNQLRIERGIIWKRYSNIPYQRIQNVDITRGVIARLCGFSSVNIHTAGYSMPAQGGAHSEGYIPAVSIDDAEKIREFVISKISKRKNNGF